LRTGLGRPGSSEPKLFRTLHPTVIPCCSLPLRLSSNPHLRKLNYDPLTSFGSICYLVRTPTVIVVNSASPYRTLADLMNAARAKPGELTLAATGPATPAQIAFEMLNVRGVAPRRLRVIAALELRPDRGAPGGDVFLAAAGYRRAAHHPEQHLRPISIPSQLIAACRT
jgi:Tripartite tricarboxylate transporter family receptor